MDLTFFRRSRGEFLCWVLIPPVLIALVLAAARIFNLVAERALDTRSELVQLVPAMEHKLAAARAATKEFAPEHEREGESIDWLSSEINRLADECGFTVEALRVGRGESFSEGVHTLSTVVRGEGSLSGIVRMVGQVQEMDSLMLVKSARLEADTVNGEIRYSGDFVFELHVLQL